MPRWLSFKIQVSAIHVDYFEPRTQTRSSFGENRFSLNWLVTNRFALQDNLKSGAFCGQGFSGCDHPEQKQDVFRPGIFGAVTFQNKNGTFCGQDFAAGLEQPRTGHTWRRTRPNVRKNYVSNRPFFRNLPENRFTGRCRISRRVSSRTKERISVDTSESAGMLWYMREVRDEKSASIQ